MTTFSCRPPEIPQLVSGTSPRMPAPHPPRLRPLLPGPASYSTIRATAAGETDVQQPVRHLAAGHAYRMATRSPVDELPPAVELP
ncbi:hypothetical protein [Streptomyces sp. rh34]|uniref:hypothetical protein n=1 Tax=Streptomyces sp. rh34 TaxID=2034272 RepID=UPI001180CE40|nr:hypothetical protein [Streptomyces sp. rh34]